MIPAITIGIPVKNEESTIIATLHAINQATRELDPKIKIETIVCLNGTTDNISKLRHIPENLFNPNLKNATLHKEVFDRTFYICRNLTGDSAKIDGEFLYNIWPDATTEQVSRMYQGATGLSDYANIPAAWK